MLTNQWIVEQHPPLKVRGVTIAGPTTRITVRRRPSARLAASLGIETGSTAISYRMLRRRLLTK